MNGIAWHDVIIEHHQDVRFLGLFSSSFSKGCLGSIYANCVYTTQYDLCIWNKSTSIVAAVLMEHIEKIHLCNAATFIKVAPYTLYNYLSSCLNHISIAKWKFDGLFYHIANILFVWQEFCEIKTLWHWTNVQNFVCAKRIPRSLQIFSYFV